MCGIRQVAWCIAWSMLLGRGAAGQGGALEVLNRDLTKVVAQCLETVVRIEPGLSGVCVSDKGYILTHIAVANQLGGQGKREVQVQFPDQRRYDAELIGSDAGTRTALLRIDDRRRFPHVRPGNPAEVELGRLLLTIGNAFDSAAESAPAVTLGVLAAIQRDPSGEPLRYETSAATNPGQHGGPVFDIDGNLVGITLDLPDGQDLTTAAPIARIRAAYPAGKGGERIFDDPPTASRARTRCQTLSRAFAIAARRARPGVCTLLVTRRDDEEGGTVTTADRSSDASRPDDTATDKAAPLVPARSGPETATLLSADGLLLTGLSAVRGDIIAIEALFHDGQRLAATVLGRDHKASLALLRVQPRQGGAPLVPLTTSPAQLAVGQFALTVAAPRESPHGDDGFVTMGIISALHQLDGWRDAVQTDAGVNVKNAGGALIDLRSRLLGVILPPDAPYGQNSGLGFAMSVDAILRSVAVLQEGRDIHPGYLGVTLRDAESPAGARIETLAADGPAEAAGLRPGDVIIELDGASIGGVRDLQDHLLRTRNAGDSIGVTVLRAGQRLALAATLARRP